MAYTNNYSYVDTPAYAFDLTYLTGYVVDSVNFTSCWGTNGAVQLGNLQYTITPLLPANGNSLAASDLRNEKDIPIATTNFTAAQYQAADCFNVTLNSAFIPYINTSTPTWITQRLANDVDNSSSGITWVSAQSSNISVTFSEYPAVLYDPFIIVTYHNTTGDVTPPMSITGLIGQSLTCDSADFQWTNPTDTDFNYTYTLKNNVFFGNLSNATTTQNWTGLAESTSYTISTHTVDLTGNMNTTWVNATVTTGACPTPTPTPTPTPSPTTLPIGPAVVNSVSCNSITPSIATALSILGVVLILIGFGILCYSSMFMRSYSMFYTATVISGYGMLILGAVLLMGSMYIINVIAGATC
jgi:hypothetical protein